MKKNLDAYKKTEVMTSNRGTLLLLMYRGVIRMLKQAIKHNDEGKHVERSKDIAKAQKIISELRCSLNFETGGDIARNLDVLYGFVTDRLMKGNLNRESQPIKEGLEILETLNQAWEQAVTLDKKSQPSEG